ncbi:MAG TPA: RNA polymerase sigma factor [Dehalococcoidia bacterium]|nr:RNA polymerase sigma factor [Dehalococcoidia bacterium]
MLDERQLVVDLARLDGAAWEAVFDANYDGIQRFAYVRTGDWSLAEEIAAETFAEAARSIHQFEYRGIPFAGWLYRIARNVVVDALKRRRRRPSVSLEVVEESAAAEGQDFENRADLGRAMRLLSPDQQTVLVLRFMNDCSLAETADATGKSVDAVKQLQRRAIAALRRCLGSAGGLGT